MSVHMRLHSPIKPTPIPPDIPRGDLPADPDTDDSEVDLPPFGRLPKTESPKYCPARGL